MESQGPHGKFVFVCLKAWFYTPALVISKRNLIRWAGLASVAVVAAGCGGIHASKSVSPLDFILPGLIQTPTVPQDLSPDPTNTVNLVAQVRR